MGTARGRNLGGGGHGPGSVDAIAKGGEDADAPVAELVADALDHDVAIIWNGGCYICLVSEELQEVFCGLGIEVVFADETADGGIGRKGAEFADERADAAPEFKGTSGLVAVPEGHFARLPGSWPDQDAVVGDFVNAPGGGAEGEDIADARFENHFLVEFADADRFLVFAGEEDAVEAAIGDGSGVEDGEGFRAFARCEEIPVAVPGDAGAELGEFVGGIFAGEEVEDVFERRAGESGEGRGAADEGEEVVNGDDGFAWELALEARHGQRGRIGDGGDDLLGEDVERIAEDGSGFDEALVHGAGDGGAGDEVGAVFGEDYAFADGSDLVAGAADALHTGGDGGRRLDLDDHVDSAHVDAELEGRGGDDGADLSGLEEVFDFGALGGGERAVMGAGEGLLGEIVDEAGKALGSAAVVDEDEGGLAGEDDGEEARRNGGPEGGAFRGGLF